MIYNANLKCYFNKNSLFVEAYTVDIQLDDKEVRLL